MPKKTDGAASQGSVRALERGLDIVDLFCRHSEPLSLTAIAAAVDLTPSTALRILTTLEKTGYVAREDVGKRFIPGKKLLRLAAPATHSHGIALIALPHMKELRDQFGETISLYLPVGQHRLCLQRVESRQPLREVINIGDTLPMGIGGAGKVLSSWIAVSPKEELHGAPAPLSEEEMAAIRACGYAVGLDERKVGVFGVASPVFDWTGDILAALSLSAPMVRFSQERLPDMIKAVMHTARLISQLLGCPTHHS